MATARSWSQQAADDYHLARELIGSVIAAQMAQISESSTEDERRRLKGEILQHAHKRKELSVDDPDAIAAVLRDYPSILRRIQAKLSAK